MILAYYIHNGASLNPGIGFQSYFLYIIFPVLLGLWAQWRVKGAFDKYSAVPTTSGLTGAQVAERILAQAGIADVRVEQTEDFLGDHYDPTKKRLCLSPAVYSQPSIAAAGIAAHEVGHAIQHARAYAPLQWRMLVIPVTQVSSQILPYVMIGGLVFQALSLIKLGIVCYCVLALFQLITLPVEFDASKRAKVILGQMGFIQPGAEATGVNRVLNAAGWTYIAAFVAALGNILHLLSILNNRRSN